MTPEPQPTAEPIYRPKPWLTWIMGVLFGLGMLYWWVGEQTLRWGRSLVAGHYAQLVQQNIKQKDWAAAGRNIGLARSWLVTDPAVLRAYADLLIATGSDPVSLLQVLKSLDAQQKATPDDRLRISQIFIALGHIDSARAEYDKLPPEQRETRGGLELLSDLLRAEGHISESEKLLRRALAMAPEDPSSRLRLAILDHENSFPEIQARSRQVLWEIAQEQDNNALRALEFLSSQTHLNGQEAEKLLTLIEAHPGALTRLRYAALSARLRARPQDRETLLAQEIERIRGQGVEALAPALQWLLVEHEPAQVVALLPDDLPLKSAQLLHPYLLAMGELHRWKEIETLLTSPKPLPVSRTFIHLWRARAAEKLGSGIEAIRHHLESAFAQTGRGADEAAARTTAEVAEQMGQWDLAAQYYQETALLQPLAQGPLMEKVYEMAMRGRDTGAAVKAAHQLADLHPENRVYTQRALYLNLMAGLDIEVTRLRLDQESSPQAYPLLRALAAYRLGDLEQVRHHLAHITDPDDLPAGQRAAHAGLLSVCGDLGAAYQLAETIPSPLLLPEEMRFLRRAL